MEETAAALAALGNMPIEQVERALAEDLPEATLVMAKGCGLPWPTVKAILRMPAGPRGISPRCAERCQETYLRLTKATAPTVMSAQGAAGRSPEAII